MRNFGYFLKQALTNFKRNLSTGIGTMITIFLSLLLIGTFFFMNSMIQSVVDSVEDKVSITCYIDDDASDADIKTVMSTIENNKYVESVSFTTKEQALENFKQSEANMDIVDQLDGENPLPRSIEVELADPQQVESVAQSIANDSTFAEICDRPTDPSQSVMYGQRSVEKLLTVTNILRYAGIVAVILLVFVTLIFINNTIRLAIMARRREIAIMRLVGATKGFIRGPFIMEGIIQALIGAILAIVVLWVLSVTVTPHLTGLISWLPVEISKMQFLGVSLILLIIGMLIGLFGSALAMRRYLRA